MQVTQPTIQTGTDEEMQDPYVYDSASQPSPLKRRSPRKKPSQPAPEVTEEELLLRDAGPSGTPAIARPTSISSERYVDQILYETASISNIFQFSS